MIRNDEHWLALTDSFYAAAFDQSGWYSALDGLAKATGSASGELIGLGNNTAVSFNLMTNVDPELNRAFIASGGGDPKINPRVNAGMNAPLLKVISESDFLKPEEHKQHPHYQQFAVPWGIPYICLTTLERNTDMLVGLAVLRNEQQGHITSKEREHFSLLAPHVRAAVRTQMALEGEGAALLMGAMDALAIPAFVCDNQRRVRALTPSAETLLAESRGLHLRQGRLQALHGPDDKNLQNAVDAAAQQSTGDRVARLRTVVVRQHAGGSSLVLDVITLPARQFEFNFAPRVLILTRSQSGQDGRRVAILQAAYGLTAAESEIAVHIANGKTPETIATLRRVSVGTVRIQIKSILAKLHVKRQVEVVAKISEL